MEEYPPDSATLTPTEITSTTASPACWTSITSFPEKSRFFNWSKPFVQLETTRGLLQHLRLLRQRWRKTRAHPVYRGNPRTAANHPPTRNKKNVRVLDRTFNYNTRRAKDLLELFLEFAPPIYVSTWKCTLPYFPKS